MANIHACRDRLAQRALASLGKPVFVNGIEYMAIIADDEYKDETGLRRELAASFDYKLRCIINTGDSVIVDAKAFKVGKLPRENTLDQFYTVELKNA